MTIKLTVTIRRDTVTPHVGAMVDRAREGLGPLQDVITRDVRQRFADEFAGGGLGGAWPPLSPATLRRHPGEVLGEFSGTLWASLTQAGATGLTKYGGASSRVFGYSELSDDGQTLRIGTRDPVAILFDAGTRHQPARQLFPDEWPREDVDKWADLWADYVVDGTLP